MRTSVFQGVRCVAMAALWIGVMVAPAWAQSGRVAGTVTNVNGDPMPGVTVTAENPDARPPRVEQQTDDGGRFSMIGLASGQWTVTAETEGYQPGSVRWQVRQFLTPQPMSFVLRPVVTRPAVPSTGLLAGVAAEDLQLELDTADTLYEAGQYDEAVEAYEAALARVPFLTTINLQIGHAYRAQKEYSKARAAYEEVLRSDPTNEEAKDALRMADLEGNGQAAPGQPRQP